MPASQILAAVSAYFMVDGFNESGIFRSLGLEHYRPFGRIYRYVYDYPDRYTIEYRDHMTGAIGTSVVEAIAPMEVGSRM